MQERYEHRGLRAMNRGNEKWREKLQEKSQYKHAPTCLQARSGQVTLQVQAGSNEP